MNFWIEYSGCCVYRSSYWETKAGPIVIDFLTLVEVLNADDPLAGKMQSIQHQLDWWIMHCNLNLTRNGHIATLLHWFGPRHRGWHRLSVAAGCDQHKVNICFSFLFCLCPGRGIDMNDTLHQTDDPQLWWSQGYVLCILLLWALKYSVIFVLQLMSPYLFDMLPLVDLSVHQVQSWPWDALR